MNRKLRQYIQWQQSLLAALAITVLAAIGSPGTATANTTANSTILNVVTVNYKDAGGTNSFAANASTIVTVNLVKAALDPSGAPTGANGTPGLTCLASGSYASGSTVSSLYALTATANGSDTYNLAIADNSPSTTANVTSVTRAYSTLDYQGLNPVANPATRILGSAIPTAVLNANTLEFPGGALAGFAVNDIVIVQTTAGKKAFLVTAVTVGTAPVFSHVGNVAYTDATGAFTTPEVKGTLTLGAYADQTITLNTPNDTTFGGGGTAPAFTTPATAATLGVPVGEMALVKVSITASTNTALDGDVGYTLTSTDSSAGNPSTITCTVGKFKAPTLTIMKQARNVSTAGAFAATAIGNPGQILEYKVTVTNTGGQASQVNVADAVPAYTTLVTGLTYGSGVGTIFAKITDNAAVPNSVELTTAVDSEIQPLTPVETGFGDAAGTTATSALKFWLGDTSTNALGGKLPACSDGAYTTSAACTGAGKDWITSYTILYQVKID